MSRRARKYRPRTVAMNTMEMAATRARKLSDTDVAQQHGRISQALAEFCRGQQCPQHWRDLADTANMAETISGMGLAAGDEAERVINNAQAALHDVHQRHSQRGTWTLYADEIDALHWLVRLHHIQLQACSYGEFETAYRRTAQRMAQALAGNASPAALVIVGSIDAHAPAAG